MNILRIKHVSERVNYHPARIRRLVKAGKFPAPIQLSPSRVAWVSAGIDEWLEAKRQECDATNVEILS
jgi:predicted DNA-binding transcriptional regulator AlpA